MKAWSAALLAACASIASADPWNNAGQFPHFRDVSGLPGCGFGLLVSGLPSINGALSLSTPIGFAMGHDTFDIGGAARSSDLQPMFPNFTSSTHLPSTGQGYGIVGVTIPNLGNLSATYEVLSSELDQCYNAQLQLPLKWDKGGVSIGCQNITDRHNAAAQGLPGEANLSRSIFGVATYEFSKNDYVSLGYGDVRFKGPFGNVSVLAAPRLKLTTEYDTFGFNSGVAYSFGGIRGEKNTELTAWAGLMDEQRFTFALNFVF
jgi:hypothetical protein